MTSRWGAIKFALITRLGFLFAMIVSSSLVPTFHAGDGVLTFDMRLDSRDEEMIKDYSGSGDCFCLKGHACDELIFTENIERSQTITRHSTLHPKCLVGPENHRDIQGSMKAKMYNLLLTPLTRWDAARFLTLAVDSRARYPSLFIDSINGECDIGQKMQGPNNTCQVPSDDVFTSSEQAHAFFPLFPHIIRYVALFLTQVVPPFFLPPTFEALIVLSGLTWNILCFIISALALQDLTHTLVRNSINQHNNSIKVDIELSVSNMTTVLYCLNPATVFFIACYSEATFSCFTFIGYAMFTRSLNSKRFGLIFGSTACWMLTSYTRSNGSLTSLFLFIHLCGALVNAYRSRRGASDTMMIMDTALQCFKAIIFNLMPIACIILPVIYHDQRGIEMHCNNTFKPHWCNIADKTFSLYGYVQDRHWNVGLFNYWTVQQLPNFLLAFPILSCGTVAVLIWIRKSWNCFEEKCCHRPSPVSPLNVLRWAFDALANMTLNGELKNEDVIHQVLFGQNMLAHYALLGGFTLLGLFIAHVQISTRMICSACPAIYWFMCTIIFDGNGKAKNVKGNTLIIYLFTFHVLSVILHVNFLPWT